MLIQRAIGKGGAQPTPLGTSEAPDPMSDDARLPKDSLRVRREGAEWLCEIADVTWPHPHEPVTVWRLFRRWRTPPDAQRLARAGQSALTNPSFYRRCQRCGQLCARGQMHDRTTCHGCAESHLGILH